MFSVCWDISLLEDAPFVLPQVSLKEKKNSSMIFDTVTLMKMHLRVSVARWYLLVGLQNWWWLTAVVQRGSETGPQWGENTPEGILTHQRSQEGGREPPTASRAVLQSKL